ncbi:DNA repair protein complementing XP-C cells [Etheostoma cragini]|uniref:DNA repair protein complementing XP-C cells n=1 Tax=Etheostoma cragini TaxID=417921 RepID=UPI00155EC352|nr:DNA repair protein complementing XP-C cells [Etheostoma cragini]
MAKQRRCAETEAHTKKLKQVLKAKSSGAKARTKKKDAANGHTEEEEKLERKVKPKPRRYTKRASGNTTSNTSTTAIAVKTSKYFQSPVKEEEPESEDDFPKVNAAAPAVTVNAKRTEKEEEEEDSEEDEDDWEEVEELSGPLGPVEPPEPVLPSQPVEIEIETPEIRKKRKRQAEFEMYLRRMMNRYKKDVLINTHKVHLMCLIASGMFRSRLCSEPDLLAITLSLLPPHFSMVAKQRIDQNYLSGLLKWFRATFTLNPSLPCEERPDPRAMLERRLASLSFRNHQEMTHLFLLVLRSLQLFCRLVLSLQPIPLKPPSAKGKGARTSTGAPGKSNTSQQTSKTTSPEPMVSTGTKRPAGREKINVDGGGKKAKTKDIKEETVKEKEKVITSGGQRPKNSKRRSIASKVSYKEESDSEAEKEEEVLSDEEDFQATSEEDSEDPGGGAKSIKGKRGKSKAKVTNSKNTAAPKKRSGGGKKQVEEEEDDVEEEEEEEGTTSNRTKRRSGKKKDGPGADEWLEVYLEKTASWVCVDVEHGVEMPHLCSQNATAPVLYVVSVDGGGFVKDLGRKYDPTWLTMSRKRRVDEEWWEETLEPFLGPEDERDRKEDKELQNKLLNKPLPISIVEYKNHPLYALKRHLLKYEAIYPSTATVLGYCRGELVYSRDCVHTLHSKDTWLKEARTVRLGEEPYKMVKGFSNRSRKARMATEQKDANDLALFGKWQTEEYQPPIAVDGKVPRNDYGNVYLFRPCMLPVGCVHLKLPNLHRVARKLNIDAAPAVTGFDFHGGYSHAVTDGYIVCEEHEEILRAAWGEEQQIQKQKEKEKKEKRVISNWTLLVKGLLIRERLKQRYGKKTQGLGGLADAEETGGLSSDEEVVKGGSPLAMTASETVAMSWPQNRQAEEEGGSISGLKKKKTTKREKRGQEKHLFPFEKV